MNNQLVLRLHNIELTPSSDVDWVLFDSDGHHLGGSTCSLDDVRRNVSKEGENFSIVVVVPGEAVSLLSLSIPTRQPRKIKQALPFMVEELVADDIENVHMALPEQFSATDDLIDTAVVSHATLIHWLDLLHSHSLSPDRIVSDVQCIPFHSKQLSLLLDDKRVLMRNGQYRGMVLQIEDFGFLFGNWLGQQRIDDSAIAKPTIHIAYSAQSASSQMAEGLDGESVKNEEPEVISFIRNHHEGYELNITAYQESVTDILASGCDSRKGKNQINLLQGGYSVSRSGESGWQHWRAAASVVGIGLLSYLLLVGTTGWYFDSQAESLDAQAATLYKQLFPNERRIVSPKKQMQNHLRQDGGITNGRFLPLLAKTSGRLSADNSELKITIDQLRFDAVAGDLQIQVRSPSIEKLDQFKRELAEEGLQVDINSATEQDDYVLGRLAVRRL